MMKIQLSRHFQNVDSPYKTYMSKLKQQQKEVRSRRFSLRNNIRDYIDIIDPLNQELQEYKNSFDKRRAIPKSKTKAYDKMRKYIEEQERKLKHVRLEEAKKEEKTFRTELTEPATVYSHQFMDQFFKNQIRDTIIHQNSLLNKTLEDKLHSIHDTLRILDDPECPHRRSTYIFDNEPEIDRTIASHRERNKKLISELIKQKHQIRQGSLRQKYHSANQPLMIVSRTKPTQKTKIKLHGLKSVQIKRPHTRNVSPSIALLLQLKNLNELKAKKQVELDTLLKNEHQNREQSLDDKSHFYEESVVLGSLNPSVQFRMRKLMNDKLLHRLKVSKDQAANFGSFLTHLRQSRTIICDDLQEFFQAIREALLGGKTLRQSDFNSILERFQEREQLKKPANAIILRKVRSMMV